MYRRLLVAVDGGDRAARAAEHAISLTSAFDAKLEILFVVDVRPVYSRYGLASLPTEDEIAHQRNHGQEIVNSVAADAVDAGLGVDTTVRRGTPHLQITEHAIETAADAVVMGEPRPRTLTRMFGVSTTDRVVRNADCTVVVVRERNNG